MLYSTQQFMFASAVGLWSIVDAYDTSITMKMVNEPVNEPRFIWGLDEKAAEQCKKLENIQKVLKKEERNLEIVKDILNEAIVEQQIKKDKLINGAKVRTTSLPARNALVTTTGKARAKSLPTLLQKFYGKRENTFWFKDSENDTITLTYENGCVYEKGYDDMEVEIGKLRVPRQNYHYVINHMDESGKPVSGTLFNFKKEQKQEQLQALKEWLKEMERDDAARTIQDHWRARQLALEQKKTDAAKKCSPK